MSTETTAPGGSSLAMVTDDVALVRLLTRTCSAEWTRLWTVKATWWFTAVATAMMVGFAAIAGFDAASDEVPPTGEPAWIAPSVTTMPAQFAFLALVLLAVTSDYGTGGILPTLQWTPQRSVLFLARTGVAVVTATAMAALLSVVAAVTALVASGHILALPWHSGADAGFDVLGDVGLVVAAGSSLAAGLGFMLRNAAGGLVTVFLLVLILPLLLPQFGYTWLTEVAERLPGTAAMFLLLGEPNGSDLTQTTAVLTLLAWAAAALVLGWLRLTRDDANR